MTYSQTVHALVMSKISILYFRSRPPLYSVGGGPGPGAYPIKTTMGKLLESNFKSPNQFSLRSRQKFGDPNERSMNKTSALEPGPGMYIYIKCDASK